MSNVDPWQFDLEGYLREAEPDAAERADAWQTGIGLQAVDGLPVSDYLLGTAKEHIEGNTRTTAVFAIKYLRTMGYEVSNDPYRTIPGTSETHSCALTTRTCREALHQPRSILRGSSKTSFAVRDTS